MNVSFNGNLVLKPWTGSKELKTKQINRGLAGVENKIGVSCLELLVDSLVVLGHNERVILKGSKIYFKDSDLHIQKWSKEIYHSEELPDGFVIGHFSQVVSVKE